MIKPEMIPQFYGSTSFVKGWCGVIYTEGIMYLMNNEASWLVTDISSYVVDPKIKREDFISIKLVAKDGKAEMVLDDGNGKVLARQRYTHVDLPDIELKMYMARNELGGHTLMLAGEY